MVVKTALCRIILASMAVIWLVVPAPAQTAASPQPPKKPGTTPRVTVPVVLEGKVVAPQVVTIVHRINGFKMFRLLLRTEEQVQAVARLDDAFNFSDDVHTNVIAGLTLDDGQTVVAWLPEEVELATQLVSFPEPRSPLEPAAAPALPSAKAATPPLKTMGGNFFGAPDLTVIGADGRRLMARYVGLDGVTGLSVLRLSDKGSSTTVESNDKGMAVGQNVRLFGPEPVPRPKAAGAGGNLYVRMGETEGTILTVVRAPSGGFTRFKARSVRLSPANIGGVAVNDAGETVGIVDSIEGTEASILPAALIRLAAKRVLARQSSVPKPWLGVRGEPVATLKVEQFLNQGWQFDRATTLADDQCGILLTWIAPGSPAALAALKAGDVILKVNDEGIRTAEDFTWLLEEAGPSNSVRFTVARPDSRTPEAINVRLSESLDPTLALTLIKRRPAAAGVLPLIDQGIETIPLKPAVASRLGATTGLLIIYVQPETPAFKAGLQPGDVIESIDGKQVSSLPRPMIFPNHPGSNFTFDIIRNKQKLILTLVTEKPLNR